MSKLHLTFILSLIVTYIGGNTCWSNFFHSQANLAIRLSRSFKALMSLKQRVGPPRMRRAPWLRKVKKSQTWT
jgi:hypothetical protein